MNSHGTESGYHTAHNSCVERLSRDDSQHFIIQPVPELIKAPPACAEIGRWHIGSSVITIDMMLHSGGPILQFLTPMRPECDPRIGIAEEVDIKFVGRTHGPGWIRVSQATIRTLIPGPKSSKTLLKSLFLFFLLTFQKSLKGNGDLPATLATRHYSIWACPSFSCYLEFLRSLCECLMLVRFRRIPGRINRLWMIAHAIFVIVLHSHFHILMSERRWQSYLRSRPLSPEVF